MGRGPGLNLPTDLPASVEVGLTEVDRAIADGDDASVLEALSRLGFARLEEHDATRASGAVFTPYGVAAELVAMAGVRPGDLVLDPAVGGGVFLLAAAEAQFAEGDAVRDIAARLHGWDIDPASLAVAEVTMRRWAQWRAGVDTEFPGLRKADGLLEQPTDRYDVVIGNPPFLGQLKTETTRSDERSQRLRERFGRLVTGYVDDSALFLLAAAELVAGEGRVQLIVPRSVLAAESAAPARRLLQERLGLRALWLGGSKVFESAQVEVVAPLLDRTGRGGEQALLVDHQNGTRVEVPAAGDRWSELLARHAEVPRVTAHGSPLRTRAAVTADFRDAYYWLADSRCSRETRGAQPVVTVGLVDPLHDRSGAAPVRFAKERHQELWACIESDGPAGVWRRRRSVPKLLVATQTKVVECVVDEAGTVLPCTPLLIVEPQRVDELWLLAAALTSPALSAWAVAESSGSGLTAQTFRLRAAQLMEAPLPVDADAWQRGAQQARSMHRRGTPAGASPSEFEELGLVMNEAYGIDDRSLVDWWLERLPRRG